MTGAPNSPLVKRVAEAIRSAPDRRAVVHRVMSGHQVIREDIRYEPCPLLQAQAALAACEAERLVKELRLAKTRLEILLGRARACHEETGQHGVTLIEAPAWIEDMEALLARLDAKP